MAEMKALYALASGVVVGYVLLCAAAYWIGTPRAWEHATPEEEHARNTRINF